MQDFKHLFARTGDLPSDGQLPQMSPWTRLLTLPLRGAALQFTEARVLGLRGNENAECHEIEGSRGDYLVEFRVARYGMDARVATLRTYPADFDPATLTRGDLIKELPVDLGGIAVVDIGIVHPSMEAEPDEHMEWIEDILYGESESPVAVWQWQPTQTKIPVVDSGFGDGSYPLHPLLSGDQVVGLEVEFLTPATPYPF